LQKTTLGARFINWTGTPWGQRFLSIFICGLGIALFASIVIFSILIYIFFSRGQITDAISTFGDLAISILFFAIYLKITR